MSPTIEDLRGTLDDVAHGYEAPDPHTVLAGAYARSGELGRRRTTHRWAAAAAAVVAIGGASLLLTDLGGDTHGEVAPAEPDESYTQGYGIIDGVPQPYADGLTLVETFDEIGPNVGMVSDEFRTDAETQMYAQAWCATGTSEVEIEVGTFETGLERLTAQCADPAVDTEHLTSPVALPPDAEGFRVTGGGSSTGAALVAIYEETEWADYPFPSWDRVSFPSADGIVIDSSTPMTTDPALESQITPRRVHSVTVPLTEEPLRIDMGLNGPGQLLVAVDGVILTNDGEELDRLEGTVPGPWDEANPARREGYLHSFGQTIGLVEFGLTSEVLEEKGSTSATARSPSASMPEVFRTTTAGA